MSSRWRAAVRCSSLWGSNHAKASHGLYPDMSLCNGRLLHLRPLGEAVTVPALTRPTGTQVVKRHPAGAAVGYPAQCASPRDIVLLRWMLQPLWERALCHAG